jgi:hypothetical protein
MNFSGFVPFTWGTMATMCDIPPEAYEDCFHPPSIPTQVFCLHCQEVYDSYLIEWREERTPRGSQGFWRCPTPGCSGAGFGFDIHPIDPDYIDPDGRDLGTWCDDDEDEEDWDDEIAAELDENEGLDDCHEIEKRTLRDTFEASDLLSQDADDFEPALTAPDAEHDPFAIPLDDLLPENTGLHVNELTYSEMDEIERKLGWRQDGGKGESGKGDGSCQPPPRSSSPRDDANWRDEDDIPY